MSLVKRNKSKTKKLKDDELPTESVFAKEAKTTHPVEVKTEFVVVTSSESPGHTTEPREIENISIKEGPIDSIQSFGIIDEVCFDEQTVNPIATNEDGNIPSVTNELGPTVLTCGRIVLEIEKNGIQKYRLACRYCETTFPTLDLNFWGKFVTHLNVNHESKIKPISERTQTIPNISNLEVNLKDEESTLIDAEKIKIGKILKSEDLELSSLPQEKNTSHIESDFDATVVGVEKKHLTQSGLENSDNDNESCDETYEPKRKKSKKVSNITSHSMETSKKSEEIISFDHPNKSCVIAFLELIRDNAILWLPRQSIIKRFGEALTDVCIKFNERFPDYVISKEQFRHSINRMKDMYNRSSDEKQKRRIKTSMYKMKYPEYFELLAAIEENSKNIKQNCELCRAVFYSPIDMQIHKAKRHKIGELPFKCKICDYGFTCPDKLASHQQKHNRVKTFICEYCNHGFYLESKLQAHLALHTDDSKQICEICGKKFPSLSKYRRHKLHHEAPKEKCELCGKLYFEKWTLSEHMKSHRNERHYKCDICGKKFNRREGVSIHKRGVHKIKTQTKRYVWVNRATNTSTSNNDQVSKNMTNSMESEMQNSNSNSSTVSSTTNVQTITDCKPAITGNVNNHNNMFPLEIFNSFLN